MSNGTDWGSNYLWLRGLRPNRPQDQIEFAKEHEADCKLIRSLCPERYKYESFWQMLFTWADYSVSIHNTRWVRVDQATFDRYVLWLEGEDAP